MTQNNQAVVNIHTMTIRRVVLLPDVLVRLFFYDQLKDIQVITGSRQPSRGAEYRIYRGSPPCRATSASPDNAWVL